MPSGGNTPLQGEDWGYVKSTYEMAVSHGLQYEWLQWFVGGLSIDKLPPKEAANAAALEWDF